MLRQLALAVFSFAIVGIVVFPYWVAVERLEKERELKKARLQVSVQCPVAETPGRVEARAASELPARP